jgi:hypothetical protein
MELTWDDFISQLPAAEPHFCVTLSSGHEFKFSNAGSIDDLIQADERAGKILAAIRAGSYPESVRDKFPASEAARMAVARLATRLVEPAWSEVELAGMSTDPRSAGLFAELVLEFGNKANSSAAVAVDIDAKKKSLKVIGSDEQASESPETSTGGIQAS